MAKPALGEKMERVTILLPKGSTRILRIAALDKSVSISEFIRNILMDSGIKLPTEQTEDKSTD